MNLEKTPEISPSLQSESALKKAREKLPEFEKLIVEKGGLSIENILNMLSKGGDVVSYFKKPSVLCPLIENGEIKFINILAKGAYGETSLVEILQMKSSKIYVVKSPLGDYKDLKPCKTSGIFKRTDDNSKYSIFPSPSYLCKENISEYLISLYIGELANKSLNFIRTFSFGICNTGKISKQYMFMEKADGSFYDVLKSLTEEEINGIYIQIVFSLALIQKEYQIVHGDLHKGNILVKKHDKSELNYGVEGNVIQIKNAPFIAVIADWGMAVKYSTPIVGNISVVKGNFGNENANFYNKAADLVYVTASLHNSLKHSGMKNKFIDKIYNWIMKKCKAKPVADVFYARLKNGKREQTHRPRADSLLRFFSHVDPLVLLNDQKLMGNYMLESKENKYTFAGVI